MTGRPLSEGELHEDLELFESLEAKENPRSPEQSAAAREQYKRLFKDLQDLKEDDISPPEGWEGRAMEHLEVSRQGAEAIAAAGRDGRPRAEGVSERKRRPGRAVLAIGAAAVIGLAAVLLLQPCSKQTRPRLEVAVSTGTAPPRRGSAAVDDQLNARARIDQAHVELRVYLDKKLIVRCPGAPACRVGTSGLELDWKLAEPGNYDALALSSDAAIPSPSPAGLDSDLLAAREAGVTYERTTVGVGQ